MNISLLSGYAMYNYNFYKKMEAGKQILISGDSLVMDIQAQFNSLYPFLKIEFTEREKSSYSFRNIMVNPGKSIAQLTSMATSKKLNVENNRTVAEVEKDLKEMLGLCVQVSRKSGNVWNVISLTDSWTLESQNKAGEFISTEMAAAS